MGDDEWKVQWSGNHEITWEKYDAVKHAKAFGYWTQMTVEKRKSRWLGVFWNKKQKTWVGFVYLNSKQHYVGSSENESEMAKQVRKFVRNCNARGIPINQDYG